MKRLIKIMKEADEDLESIWFYGYWNFGSKKAKQYVLMLHQRFSQLATNELGRKRPELGKNVFALPHREHVIYYRSEVEKVFIVRVLHHSQDALVHFPQLHWL